MTIAERAFADLDDDDVAAALAEVEERVQEDNPHVDVRRGVFHDLVLHYHAILATRLQANVRDYLDARSLKQINADPALADPDVVDDVLSNFRVTRKEGAAATGEVAVVRDNNLTATLALGTRFTANGLGYATAAVYTAKAEASQIDGETDRLITQLRDGNYVFSVPVVAEETGAAYAVPRDTLMVPDIAPAGYLTSYAATDFTGGLDTETNQELLDRFQQGVAAKTLSNRVNMAAMLREIEAFSRLVAMSIVGYGDPEMLRDRHWIFPVSGGGRVDWYVRSAERFERVVLAKEATLVEKTADLKGVWRFAVTRDDAPGFYEVASIRLPTAEEVAGGYEVTQDVRSTDLTGDGFRPDVASDAEGEYTAFQTAAITFEDTDTDTLDLEPGDKQTYAVELKAVPLIADIQETVSSRDVRHYGADCLVKAPVPCFVQLSFTVYKEQGQDDPDADAIAEALCTLVNTTGFTGALYASAVHDVVHGLLESGMTVGAIDMFGRLRYPGGSAVYVRDPDVLRVPDEPELGVSRRTVQFFMEPEDVAVAVVAVAAAEV